jgi:hypothetical protein
MSFYTSVGSLTEWKETLKKACFTNKQEQGPGTDPEPKLNVKSEQGLDPDLEKKKSWIHNTAHHQIIVGIGAGTADDTVCMGDTCWCRSFSDVRHWKISICFRVLSALLRLWRKKKTE